jgi:hypothetical protein
LFECGGRGWDCALASTLVAEAYVLHKYRGDDGESDGYEGEHEAVVDGVRETNPGRMQDLIHDLFPTGEGGSDAIQCAGIHG